MSVDNINVSLSRLALAKAIKTPDAGEDESEPWTNSVIFHQSHIDSNMRNTILGGPQKHRPHPDRARSNQQQYQQQQHHQQQYQQNQNQQYRSQYNNRNDPRKNSPVPRVTRPPQEPISARQSGMSAMPHDNSRRPLPTITGKGRSYVPSDDEEDDDESVEESEDDEDEDSNKKSNKVVKKPIQSQIHSKSRLKNALPAVSDDDEEEDEEEEKEETDDDEHDNVRPSSRTNTPQLPIIQLQSHPTDARSTTTSHSSSYFDKPTSSDYWQKTLAEADDISSVPSVDRSASPAHSSSQGSGGHDGDEEPRGSPIHQYAKSAHRMTAQTADAIYYQQQQQQQIKLNQMAQIQQYQQYQSYQQQQQQQQLQLQQLPPPIYPNFQQSRRLSTQDLLQQSSFGRPTNRRSVSSNNLLQEQHDAAAGISSSARRSRKPEPVVSNSRSSRILGSSGDARKSRTLAAPQRSTGYDPTDSRSTDARRRSQMLQNAPMPVASMSTPMLNSYSMMPPLHQSQMYSPNMMMPVMMGNPMQMPMMKHSNSSNARRTSVAWQNNTWGN